jgi:hypothetical protein
VADLSSSPSSSSPSAGTRPLTTSAPLMPVRRFSGEVGVVLHWINPDRTADFEMVIARLQQALASSGDPARRAQANGWKVFKCLDKTAVGDAVAYVFLIDRVVPGADYDVINVLAEAFPQEYANLARKYIDAYAATGQNWLNLSLIEHLGRQ